MKYSGVRYRSVESSGKALHSALRFGRGGTAVVPDGKVGMPTRCELVAVGALSYCGIKYKDIQCSGIKYKDIQCSGIKYSAYNAVA